MNETLIEATGLSVFFGEVRALDGVDLQVPAGSVTGLLGHNGAGKTTLINVLSTLLRPDSGSATVAGFDVLRQAPQVRSRIGLTGQYAAVDEYLSGLDNLVLVARLLGAGEQQARQRADELLTLFDLSAAAGRSCATYSGGMRRRLDLACALVGRPSVIFLDEPTTGLDPVSRMGLWDIVTGLVDQGAAVLLTTQYLDEADRLADRITVLAEGRVVANDTAAQLKAGIGSRAVHLKVEADDVSAAMLLLTGEGADPRHDPSRSTISAPMRTPADLTRIVRALEEARIELLELEVIMPTLDDVYLELTSRARTGTGSPRLTERIA